MQRNIRAWFLSQEILEHSFHVKCKEIYERCFLQRNIRALFSCHEILEPSIHAIQVLIAVNLRHYGIFPIFSD